MKDIIEEIDSRIKSPFFGYFLFSSVAINWEQLFYLIVHNGTVSERIDHFNNGSDLWSLVLFPLILASAYSIFYPWLQFVFMFLSKKPTELQNSLQAQSENNLLIEKQELEKSRTELLKEAEQELIERAKRDAKLNEIEDEAVREKLQTEIDSLRKERDDIRGSMDKSSKVSPATLTEDQEEIIRLITSVGGSINEYDIIKSSKFDKVKTEYYLEDLENNGYLKKDWDADRDYYYDLTTKSKKIMVDKGVVQ